jgi:hypothetical protein
MKSTAVTPWFCRFCAGPLPASGTVSWLDDTGPLTFCSQACCDQFKAKATRPDSPHSRRKRVAQ